MKDKIKTGRDVIEDFFAEILNIPNTHNQTVQKIIDLYSAGKLTDTNLQNALDKTIEDELNQLDKDHEN